jgi:hypothetical protein
VESGILHIEVMFAITVQRQEFSTVTYFYCILFVCIERSSQQPYDLATDEAENHVNNLSLYSSSLQLFLSWAPGSGMSQLNEMWSRPEEHATALTVSASRSQFSDNIKY